MKRAPRKSSLSVRKVGWIALAAGLAISPWIHSVPAGYLAVPLLISILVLGLPHGALDHRTAALVWPMGRTQNQLIFHAAYLGLAGSYLLLWFIDPLTAFALFLILTIFHWGQGDIDFGKRQHDGAGLSEHPILMTLVRGGAPVILPILFWPSVVESVAGWTMALFPSSALVSTGISPTLPGSLRILLGGLFFAAVARAVMLDLPSKRRVSGSGGDAAAAVTPLWETVGLVLFFSLVHPLLAIGLYFPFWHGLRHLDGLRTDLSRGAEPLAWREILVAALPLTVVSVILMAALGLLVAGRWNLTSVAGLYLVLLAILTLPHAVVVGARDYFGRNARRAPRPFSPETKTQNQNQTSHA